MNTLTTESKSLGLIFAASHEATLAQSLQRMAHGLERLEDEYEALVLSGASTGIIAKNRLTHNRLQSTYTQTTQDWHAARAEVERASSHAREAEADLPYVVQERASQYCSSSFTSKHQPAIVSIETSQWPEGDLVHTIYECTCCQKFLGEKTTPFSE